MKLDIWPFNIKEKERENRENREKQVAEFKAQFERNKVYLKEWLARTVQCEVLRFKENNPQPFKEGDLVTIHMAKRTESIGNWFALASHLKKEFGDIPEVKKLMDLPVARVWASTGFLEEIFSMNNLRIDSMVRTAKTTNALDSMLSDLLVNARRQYGVDCICEWAFDADWKKLRIPYARTLNNEGYLDIKWGGFPAKSVCLADSEYAKAEKDIWDAQMVINNANSTIKKIEKEIKIHTQILNLN